MLFGAAIGLCRRRAWLVLAPPMVSLQAPFTLRARIEAGRSTG